MKHFTIPKDDVGFKLKFTVRSSTGTVVDLTAYTAVHIKMWVPGIPGTLLLDKACANLAADGTCDYTVATADFAGAAYPAVGRYLAELELTAVGIVESTENFTITIVESG